MYDKNKFRTIPLIQYIFLACLYLVIFFIYIKTYRINLRYPLVPFYDDNIFLYTAAKSIKETGWVWNFNRMGAPFYANGFDLLFYALSSIDNLVLKSLFLFTDDYVLAANLLYLFNFPFISLISYYVIQKFTDSSLISCITSIIFSFSPYIFYRGIMHYMLSGYQFVPLTILVCVWLNTEQEYLNFDCKFFKNRMNVLTILFCFCIANNGEGYYQAFSCMLIALTGVISFSKKSSKKIIVKTLFIVAILIIFSSISILPNWNYFIKNGINNYFAKRRFVHSEIYGLKISSLFIPHRWRFNLLRNIIEVYNTNSMLNNEGRFAYLGIFGSLCFTLLLVNIINKRILHINNKLLNLFSILNVAIILISTVGGFGAIFALVVTPQIRAWNRLSIYILFISLSGGAIVLSRFIQRIKNQNIFKIILILIGFFSIIEQKPENLPIDIDNYKMMIKDYKETKSFIEKIEESIDKGSMIFQLPYLMFPEGGVIRNLKPYQLVEGFLHTSGIRWSYGGTINRQSDIFNRAVSQLSVEKMIKVLVIVGFRGIYIDSRAYDYRDLDQLIKKIEDTVESKPLKSNNKILFYDLQKYGDHYLSLYKGKEIDKIKSELLNTLNIPSPWSGVYTFEGDSRWLNKDAVFIIYNPRQMKVEYDLKFSLNTKYEDYSDVTVNLNGMAINNYKINSLKRECYERIWLEPGQNTIQFKTNGKPYKIEGDKRELYIELNNLYPFSNIGLK